MSVWPHIHGNICPKAIKCSRFICTISQNGIVAHLSPNWTHKLADNKNYAIPFRLVERQFSAAPKAANFLVCTLSSDKIDAMWSTLWSRCDWIVYTSSVTFATVTYNFDEILDRSTHFQRNTSSEHRLSLSFNVCPTSYREYKSISVYGNISKC